MKRFLMKTILPIWAIWIALLGSAICSNAQYEQLNEDYENYILFRDTLPANRVILLTESNSELYFDVLRTFNSDFIMTYKPHFKDFDGVIKLAIMGGIYNNKIALGVVATGTIIGRYNEERFDYETTEGLEGSVGFMMTSGKTELYIIPGVCYKIHIYNTLFNYIIVSPGCSLWLGTTNSVVVNLNIGIGI